MGKEVKGEKVIRELELSKSGHAKSPELELYSNIIEQVKDLALIKQVNEETAALILILNELRQIHWHLDELRESRKEGS